MANPTDVTIPAFFARSIALRGEEPAVGTILGGKLHWRTWRGLAEDALRLALAMRALGVASGDRVAQVSENRYEWIVTDLAIHIAGAVHVPIHVTLSGEQIAEQISDCGARLVFVSSEELLATFRDHFDSGIHVLVHNEFDVNKSQQGEAPGQLPTPDDLATILYTSGTTGRPRGVMLSQRNLATNAAAVATSHGGGNEQIRLCVLPLSHIYARTCDLYTLIYRGSRLVLAESRETLARDCQLAQPTAMSAVPHVYQRIADAIRSSGAADEAAVLRATFGGCIERLTCGGASLAPEYEIWFAERGLPVTSGYGLTEASPVVTTSNPIDYRMGCVGRPINGVELKLADDGEILVRSPSVMIGYWNDPAATAEAIRDGWLHTGDLGALDSEGYLRIDGRKKELIVLSIGKKVSPTRIESLLTASPLVEQAAVFGEGQPALVALLVVAALDGEPASRESVAKEISRCLASASQEEQVRDFIIASRSFSIEQGELTPKLSLCRATIAQNFAAELATLSANNRSSSRPADGHSGIPSGATG